MRIGECGPSAILMGLSKPVHILARLRCEIVNMAAIAVVDAQEVRRGRCSKREPRVDSQGFRGFRGRWRAPGFRPHLAGGGPFIEGLEKPS
jgi:hypothetical protein